MQIQIIEQINFGEHNLIKLAEIQSEPVQRQYLTREIRMVGKVDYDETRIRTVAAWIPGQNRLERLFVDYTGVPVRAGDHLVVLYSPELLTAWTDPDFDPDVPAVYYARVIEIPTPRWTAYEAVRFGIDMPEEIPMTTQERAYTSPIWYTP